MQYHIGILSIGTVAWIIQQTIEKYCKAILNKSDPNKYSDIILSKKPYSHDLIRLWEEIKANTIQFSFENAYEDFVIEVNNITTKTRYLNCSMGMNLGLIETFTILGCEFRYELLGKDDFHNRFFGLKKDLISTRFFLNFYSFESLFKKLMHLSVEHGISFSGMGIPDTFEWTKVNLSKASAKFCQCGKHKELEENCPLCRKTIWQNGLRDNKQDAIILKEYMGI
jgi:hypothetical protein